MTFFHVASIPSLNSSKELLPTFSNLIMDPFASHVIRSLLVLLCPNLAKEGQVQTSLIRYKKSSTWKAKQGLMKSVFGKGKGKEPVQHFEPPMEFREMARKFIEFVRSDLDDNEVRAMAANKVASPGLQVRQALCCSRTRGNTQLFVDAVRGRGRPRLLRRTRFAHG